MGVQIPGLEGAMLGDRGTHSKVQELSAVSCAKTAELIEVPFGLCIRVGRRMHKFNRTRQVEPMCLHGKTRCRHLANTIELSVCGGDKPCVKYL